MPGPEILTPSDRPEDDEEPHQQPRQPRRDRGRAAPDCGPLPAESGLWYVFSGRLRWAGRPG